MATCTMEPTITPKDCNDAWIDTSGEDKSFEGLMSSKVIVYSVPFERPPVDTFRTRVPLSFAQSPDVPSLLAVERTFIL